MNQLKQNGMEHRKKYKRSSNIKAGKRWETKWNATLEMTSNISFRFEYTTIKSKYLKSM